VNVQRKASAKEELAEELASHATRIVNGEAAVPRPGTLCKVCQFAKQCLPDI
jgi:CRISPR/Cas system-associated exonuclease Cas4 (RecB family)